MSNEAEITPIPEEVLFLIHKILDQNNEILRSNARLLDDLTKPILRLNRVDIDEAIKKSPFFTKQR